MPHNVVVLLDNPEGVEMTKRICKERGLDFRAFCELVQVEVDQTGKQKKRGVSISFDDILDRIEDTSD